ncbi:MULTISPECIES: sugar ABC transporter permease [unclassified Bosea (in: a-proteobacteria)]|uniref:carbohydrate ABC transporter permease n=1 Tax=unclassified Bosea (in: a-proteobacteria) TaxID=2653178 RepID=UPI0013E056E6|nr:MULTISPECIES: sugar ABC transporter permease [unclassified Bosea (in: a-proteobacteria)]
MLWPRLRRGLTPYLFLAPFFLTFIAFWLGPIIASLIYSFTDWRGFASPRFIGFANYSKLFADPRFWVALKNTLFYGVVYVTILNVSALALALCLDSLWLRFKNAVKVGFFLPVTISLVVAAVIFEMIFAKGVGLLNIVQKGLGLGEIDWLGDPRFSIWAIIILRVWRALGYYAVIYFAGLQGIPTDVKEAARLDGCSPWQVTRHVTLPLLKPVILFGVIMSTIWALELFDEPWVLTKGGPADSTLTIVIYLYQAGFQYVELGYAAAVSYVLTLMIVAIAIVQKLLSGREVA